MAFCNKMGRKRKGCGEWGICEFGWFIREIVCSIGELPGSIQLSLSIFRRYNKYIGDFRNISAPYQKYQRLSTIYQLPPKNSGPRSTKNEPHPVQLASLKLIKITLSTLNTHIIINKDQLRGFSLPLLLLLHSQLMYLVHILIDRIHDLEHPLFSYLPFLSFSFEDLLSHGDHTLHRLV